MDSLQKILFKTPSPPPHPHPPSFGVSSCTVGVNGNLCWLSAPCNSTALLAPPVSMQQTVVVSVPPHTPPHLTPP